jgi:hypothetical protein
MMALAMISEIQSEDIIAVTIQGFTGANDVGRINTAFPSMQQYDKAFGLDFFLGRIIAEKSNAIGSLQYFFNRSRLHLIFSPGPEFGTGQYGLGLRTF